MTILFKKNSAYWLSAFFLIAFMSFSTAGNAESDPMNRMGREAGGPAYRPEPPAGIRGVYPGPPADIPDSRQQEDSINVQSHTLSEPGSRDERRPYRDRQRDWDRE
jgi:hypothetical protein